MINKLKLIFSLLICQLPGILGYFFTDPSSLWYQTLIKPSFTPPNYLFSPVWITLYFLMGITLYLLWIKKDKIAITLFSIQLFLNALWSFLFFKLNSLLFSFIEIIFLWIFILLTIIKAYKTSKIASYLLMPYLLWVTFALILNLSLLLLN